MATCPECDADVEVDEVDADVGDEVSCPECGQNLVVSNTNPLELDFAADDEKTTKTTTMLEDDEDEPTTRTRTTKTKRRTRTGKNER